MTCYSLENQFGYGLEDVIVIVIVIFRELIPESKKKLHVIILMTRVLPRAQRASERVKSRANGGLTHRKTRRNVDPFQWAPFLGTCLFCGDLYQTPPHTPAPSSLRFLHQTGEGDA